MSQKEDKANFIIQKAKEIFMRYGLRSVTMDDLASELGMSKKTLYSFFRDKKTLIEKILETELKRMDEIFNSISENSLNAVDVLIQINDQIIRFISNRPANVNYDLRKYYPELWKKVRDVQKKKMFDAIIKNLKRGIEEGLIRDDIIPEIIAYLQIQRSMVLFDEEFADLQQKFSKELILKETLKYHIYGICTPKGIEFFNSKIQNK